MLQNQRVCQLVRSKTGCEPLALVVAWGARTAGRCAAGVLGAVKHQRFSDQQLETFAARAPGICPKPVCDAGEPCPLPPQDDAVDVSVIVPVHNGERFLRACLDSILHQNTTRRLQVLAAQARTGADIVQGGWQYCDEADTCGAVQQYAEACYTGPRRLDVVELPGTPWGKLYRRTLFERVRFPSGYTCFEDAMIHFWVFPRAKCIASTKPAVYLWRKNTMGLTATSQNTAKALQAYWVAEEMLDGAVRLGLPQDALFACNLILQLANYCYVCVAGLPEADRQTAFACCCLLYRRWAAKLPDPRTLPYAVRLAQRALEQADYGLWQLQGRLFQLIN